MIKDILKAETTKDDFFRDNSLKFIVTCKATLPDQKFNKKSIKGYFCKKKTSKFEISAQGNESRDVASWDN